MNRTLVIFDCDGVLVDSESIACRMTAESLSAVGYPITTEDVIRRFCGSSRKSIIAMVEADIGRALPEGFEEDHHARLLKKLSDELQPIDGIADVLEVIADKCIASGGSADKIENSLRVTGLAGYFAPDALFSATMVEHGKPAPDLFLLAAERMGFAPVDCVVIEDSLFGVQAGKAAGMRVFGFTGASHIGPGHEQALRLARADAIFSDMRELPRLLGLAPARSRASG